MRILLVLAVTAAAGTLAAQSVTFEGRPALVLANDKLELTVLLQGTGMASLVLKDDPGRTNPLWHPDSPGQGIGHFLCVDGFGGVSAEERAAGFPSHGEAHL